MATPGRERKGHAQEASFQLGERCPVALRARAKSTRALRNHCHLVFVPEWNDADVARHQGGELRIDCAPRVASDGNRSSVEELAGSGIPIAGAVTPLSAF